MRENYNECRADLMDTIADELPIITDLTQSIAELQNFCHRSFWEAVSDTTYNQVNTSSIDDMLDDLIENI